MDFMLGHGHKEFDNHALLAFCRDAGTGLSAIIAIHSRFHLKRVLLEKRVQALKGSRFVIPEYLFCF
jgi:hypothetical protein